MSKLSNNWKEDDWFLWKWSSINNKRTHFKELCSFTWGRDKKVYGEVRTGDEEVDEFSLEEEEEEEEEKEEENEFSVDGEEEGEEEEKKEKKEEEEEEEEKMKAKLWRLCFQSQS